MNKKLYYTICSSVIGAFLVVWIITFTIFSIKNKPIQNENKNNEKTNISQNASSLTQNLSSDKNAESDISEHYLIKCENERLIVYHISNEGEKTFYQELNINVSHMRKADKEAFLSGVTVKDDIELAHIIEDYTSWQYQYKML